MPAHVFGYVNFDFSAAHVVTACCALAAQICEVSDGPCKYVGKNMREAHAGIGIGAAEIRVFLDDLRRALEAAKIPAHEQDELLSLLGNFHGEIVEAQ